ncbi:MAG: toxic anion resistance protein [archaeon]
MTTKVAVLEKSTGLVEQLPMVLPDVATIKQELALIPSSPQERAKASSDPETEKMVDEFVQKVLSFSPGSPEKIEEGERCAAAIMSMGEKTQREAAQLSNSPMLKSSIKTLAAKGEDGGEIAKTLLELNHKVVQLDPSDIDFSKRGAFKRLLYAVPFIGSPMAKYFARYEQADSIIAEIIQSLINGREQLGRDNQILNEDKKRMLIMTIQLQKAIGLGRILDEKLSAAMGQMNADDPRYKFIGEELIFPLRQRVLDLEQQLAVNQQGAITFEIIIRNNRELINGVKRAEFVTITALNIAVAAALALGHQAMVLKALKLTNVTTSDLIRKTSERLRKQAAQVHEQASGSMLDIEALQQSFTNLKATLEEISTYRLKALPMMKQNIETMFRLGEDAQQAIEKMERGDRTVPTITLDVAAN